MLGLLRKEGRMTLLSFAFYLVFICIGYLWVFHFND